MASFDESVKSSSEESFQLECSPCGLDGAVREAVYFCTDCQEYLCQPCEAQHKRFKATRDHIVSLYGDVKLVSQEDGSVFSCGCKRHKVEIYCEYHDAVFCADCKTIKHRQCKTKPLDTLVSELGPDFEAKANEYANEVKCKIEKLIAERKQSLQRVCGDADISKEDIILLTNEVKNKIDKLKANTLDDLNRKVEPHKETIDQHINACETALKTLSSVYTEHEKLLMTESKQQKFLSQLNLRKTMNDLDTFANDIREETYEPKVSFERNQTLLDGLNTLGLVKSNYSASQTFNADMTVLSSRRVDIQLSSDKSIPWITSSVFLPNGEVILCDRGNNCVKHFDSEFVFSNSLQLPGMPRGCCLVNDTELLVSLSNKNQIQRYQVFPSMILKGTIRLDIKCEDIHAFGKHIYVLCNNNSTNKEVRVLDENGSLKRQICLNENDKDTFLCPFYLTVSDSGDVYVAEYGNDLQFGQIRCFKNNGTLKYTFSNKELTGTGGIFLDDEGRLLACFCFSNKIKLISKDGSTFGDLFKAGVDMLEKPYSISYRKSDCTLIVGYRDNSNITVYRLQ